MSGTTPSVDELCRALLADIDEMSGALARLSCTVRSTLLDSVSKAKDSTPPGRDRYVTALGDRRERAVQCWNCGSSTYAIDQTCDPCHGKLDKAQGHAEDFGSGAA